MPTGKPPQPLSPVPEEFFLQNVVVMRHGDRIDHLEPLLPLKADRPWDPPLTDDGKNRAWSTGRRLRPFHLGFRIHRVLVSPFLRCLQTASEVISALRARCEDEASLLSLQSSHGVPIDPSAVKVSSNFLKSSSLHLEVLSNTMWPYFFSELYMAASFQADSWPWIVEEHEPSNFSGSKFISTATFFLLQVSIEYGLSEIMSNQTIKIDSAPKDGNWFPAVSELETVFPAGTVDHSTGRVYHELPLWEEELREARKRYEKVILDLADMYPNENLLLVTHGEGVGVSISSFMEGFEVWEVNFCAYSHLQRKVPFENSAGSHAKPFQVLTENGMNGIHFCSMQEEMVND